MNLPTEEDVLAMLVLHDVLRQCVGKRGWMDYVQASRDMNDRWPAGLREICARRVVAHGRNAEAAIADSERRLEVERAEREVLVAAEGWRRADNFEGTSLDGASARLRTATKHLKAARRALEGK